eukprot:m.243244 g.243244  ORF g.243244 m.243244 type:complete len:621 (-) comp14197_c0_seq1:211-2073(-)
MEVDPADLKRKGSDDAAGPDAKALRPDVPDASPAVAGAVGTGARLTDTDVGITMYVTEHAGFRGTIKQRFSDFLVYEVDTAGNVVHLTPTELPSDAGAAAAQPDEGNSLPSAEQEQELTALLGAEMLAKLHALNQGPGEPIRLPPQADKEQRTRVHRAIAPFGHLNTTTEADATGVPLVQVNYIEKKPVRVAPTAKASGPYCQFVLLKTNKDTISAVSLLARFMHINEGRFTYSGTKDRRAITTQLVTAQGVGAAQVAGLNKRLIGIRCGNFKPVREPLRLGALSGNRFVITLRNVDADVPTIDAALAGLRDHGFINYFGMQRFGTTSIGTHVVGRALLRGAWADAVSLILDPRPGEDDDITAARRVWKETGDANKTMNKMPSRCRVERQLLQNITATGPADRLGALVRLPRNLRLLYVHSYQSFIWNQVVSARLSLLGPTAVAGDLVLCDTSAADGEGIVSCDDDKEIRVKILTADDAPSYTLQDIVLPLPGYAVVYPTNIAGDRYQELMAADGLDPRDMRRKQREFSLSGGYRRPFAKPKDMTWSVMQYDDFTIPLTRSDFEVLDGAPEPVSVEGGKLRAVVLSMTLDPSTYATMALREAMRIPTDAGQQAATNQEDA